MTEKSCLNCGHCILYSIAHEFPGNAMTGANVYRCMAQKVEGKARATNLFLQMAKDHARDCDGFVAAEHRIVIADSFDRIEEWLNKLDMSALERLATNPHTRDTLAVGWISDLIMNVYKNRYDAIQLAKADAQKAREAKTLRAKALVTVKQWGAWA